MPQHPDRDDSREPARHPAACHPATGDSATRDPATRDPATRDSRPPPRSPARPAAGHAPTSRPHA